MFSLLVKGAILVTGIVIGLTILLIIKFWPLILGGILLGLVLFALTRGRGPRTTGTRGRNNYSIHVPKVDQDGVNFITGSNKRRLK